VRAAAADRYLGISTKDETVPFHLRPVLKDFRGQSDLSGVSELLICQDVSAQLTEHVKRR
jgi:hypothetical protein